MPIATRSCRGCGELADECHEHDCKVMIQLTHLGRRTGWNKADWLPVLSASPVREPAHRAFPKEAEDWDIERIVADYASAAQRMQAAGLDGIEFEAYGHLMDGFWSPATNRREDEYGGSLDNRLRFTWRGDRCGAQRRSARTSSSASAWSRTRISTRACRGRRASRSRAGWPAPGKVDFLNIIRGSYRYRRGADQASSRSPACARRRISISPARCGRRRSSRCSTPPASPMSPPPAMRSPTGKLDMVGMTRAHIADPHIVQQGDGGARAPDPPLRRRDLLPRPHL